MRRKGITCLALLCAFGTLAPLPVFSQNGDEPSTTSPDTALVEGTLHDVRSYNSTDIPGSGPDIIGAPVTGLPLKRFEVDRTDQLNEKLRDIGFFEKIIVPLIQRNDAPWKDKEGGRLRPALIRVVERLRQQDDQDSRARLSRIMVEEYLQENNIGVKQFPRNWLNRYVIQQRFEELDGLLLKAHEESLVKQAIYLLLPPRDLSQMAASYIGGDVNAVVLSYLHSRNATGFNFGYQHTFANGKNGPGVTLRWDRSRRNTLLRKQDDAMNALLSSQIWDSTTEASADNAEALQTAYHDLAFSIRPLVGLSYRHFDGANLATLDGGASRLIPFSGNDPLNRTRPVPGITPSIALQSVSLWPKTGAARSALRLSVGLTWQDKVPYYRKQEPENVSLPDRWKWQVGGQYSFDNKVDREPGYTVFIRRRLKSQKTFDEAVIKAKELSEVARTGDLERLKKYPSGKVRSVVEDDVDLVLFFGDRGRSRFLGLQINFPFH